MEMYQFLDANLQALQSRGSKACAWIEANAPALRALQDSIVVNRFGLMDMPLEGGGTLFGTMPPQAFYQGWEPRTKPETSATIIVGCNLGYGLNFTLTHTPPSHKVIVLEPRPDVLGLCLGQTDYAGAIEAGKLHFIPPDAAVLQSVIGQIDLQLVHGQIYLRLDTPSQQMGPEYARWSQTARRLLENFAVEMTTMRKRQDLMVGNELANYQRAFADGSMAPLWGAGRGLSAVLLGAGPSLERFAPALAQSRGHALYAAGVQTLPALRRLGLKPDVCMAIDYSQGLCCVLDNLDQAWCADIPMIYSTKVQPRLVQEYPGPTLPMWTVGGLGTFVLKDIEPILDAGGSVSVALLRWFEALGAGQVLLVGQDFGWQGNASHVTGHHAGALDNSYDPKRHVLRQNGQGETVVTAMPYLTAKRDMEADIARMDIPVFNLYGGCLEVEGARKVDPRQVFRNGLNASTPGAMACFARAMSLACRPRSRPVFEARSARWGSSLRAVTRRMDKLFRRPGPNGDAIHEALGQVLVFMKQDRLYTPYLFNEIMDMAGLVHARMAYRRTDFLEFKRLCGRILAKVREMDAVLGAGRADVRAA